MFMVKKEKRKKEKEKKKRKKKEIGCWEEGSCGEK